MQSCGSDACGSSQGRKDFRKLASKSKGGLVLRGLPLGCNHWPTLSVLFGAVDLQGCCSPRPDRILVGMKGRVSSQCWSLHSILNFFITESLIETLWKAMALYLLPAFWLEPLGFVLWHRRLSCWCTTNPSQYLVQIVMTKLIIWPRAGQAKCPVMRTKTLQDGALACFDELVQRSHP